MMATEEDKYEKQREMEMKNRGDRYEKTEVMKIKN